MSGPFSIALFGHAGRMGAMFAARLRTAGHEVRGVDLARPVGHDAGSASLFLDRNACAHAVKGATVVLLCVPVSAYRDVLGVLRPLLLPSQLLMDIGSVKTLPLQWMEAAHQGPTVGTHPLFGPNPVASDNPVAALVPGTRVSDADLAAARALFQAAGFGTFTTTAEEHDRAVAYVQCLNFMTSAAYFAAVPQSASITPFLTPSFRRRLAEQRKLLTEDAPMFRVFTEANPLMGEVLEHFRAMLREAESGGLERLTTQAAGWYREGY